MSRTADGRALVLGYPATSQAYVDYCQAYEDNREHNRRHATTLTRSAYGEINAHTVQPVWDGYTSKLPADHIPAPAAYWKALDLLRASKLDSYNSIERDRKGRFEGTAAHLELYDFAPDAHAIVVCQRETEGNRYGVRTISKTYYLVQRTDDGETAAIETKQPVARMAGLGLPWGTIVEAAETGKRPKLTPKATLRERELATRINVGYKLLAQRNGDPNHLASVWDGSEWDIGTERIERVKKEHGGGLYYYRDLAECLEAAASNSVFTAAHDCRKLILVQVEATGRHVEYAGGKYAAEKITPVAVLASII
jgi:hypothetical protein